jgi:hypothetical protein
MYVAKTGVFNKIRVTSFVMKNSEVRNVCVILREEHNTFVTKVKIIYILNINFKFYITLLALC